MKIVLISPSGIMYRKKDGIFPRALRYAPLTLTTLASLVPQELNAQITLIDEGVEHFDPNIEANLVGISAITGTSNRAYAIARHFRHRGIPVVMGGVHTTLMPQEAKLYADSVVTGLAYESWPRCLNDFNQGNLQPFYSQQPNISLEGLPFPRKDLLKKFSYLSNGSTQATFGCPYRCDFCAVVATQKSYLRRPAHEMIDEIRRIKSKFIVFVDPSPMEDRDYAMQLYREMIPLKKQWGGLSTVKAADDDELMDLVAKSGCKGLLLGFESVTQESANQINKRFNKVEIYKDVVRRLHDRGIAINGTFMFGMDSDTEDSFKQTVDFVNEAKIDLPRYAIYTPFPGTPIYQRLEKEGRILTKNWTLYDGQHVVYQPKCMTAERLREGHLWAWKNTYAVKSILNRISDVSGFPMIPFITNLGYRYYANRLKNFPDDIMVQLNTQWNDSLNHSSDLNLAKHQSTIGACG